MKTSFIVIFSAIILLAGCVNKPSKQEREKAIYTEIQAGNFTKADSLIQKFLTDFEVSDSLALKLQFEQERMHRIRMDFRHDEAYIKEKLSDYYPELKNDQIRTWENNRDLEMMWIDGERRYFNWAHRNLFRVNEDAKVVCASIDKNQSDGITEFCEKYVPEFTNELRASNKVLSEPYHFKVKYTITVDSGKVPVGDTIRVWMPFPKPNKNRQFDIKLMGTNVNDHILSPEDQVHRSIYMEQPSKKGATVFQIEYSFSTRAAWYGHKMKNIQPYNKNSELYKKYTSERTPHVVFTNRIKHLADSVVGETTDPYETVKKIYTWIDLNIPWASAREYSTILNIPEYALINMHGDCGIQTLLFMTMARYKGIPAKWQSGWLTIPGEVNLHDWAEVYYEGIGWVPVDQSYEMINSDNPDVRYFYTCGIDPYRLIVNDGYSGHFYPEKEFFRSETVDFQRGEVEWKGGNLYFKDWDYDMQMEYIKK